jgi:5'-nucleotidase
MVQTRMTGNAHVNEAVLDTSKGTFTWANIQPYAAGVNTCLNGDCRMPGETYIVEHGIVAISLYTIDYTTPTNSYTEGVMERLNAIAIKC